MIFIDTNVLVDIATRDPLWAHWSLAQLESASISGALMINDVVYAELCVRYERKEDVDGFLAAAEVDIAPMHRDVLFLAGKVFGLYRNAGGTKSGVLPDFFIGAHASVLGCPLLTRDVRRYRTYFPKLELITPETP